MPTYSALTTTTDKPKAEGLGVALEELDPAPTGVGVFEMEDGSGLWEVGAYFLEAPDDVVLALLAAAHGAKPFVISEVPDIDWVAHVRRELAPVVAGRFFVYGSHDADKLPDDATGLLIEAAMAFGTGHHGTTQGCLQLFDQMLTVGHRPANVADIGCGTAVLAMAAARELPEARVLASDMDQVAVDVALSNIAANDLEGRIACVTAPGFDHAEIGAMAPYDLIFANILKGPLLELAPALSGHLSSGGRAILSGLLLHQRDEIVAGYAESGLELEQFLEIGDWVSLLLTKK